jgi:predicted ATPase
LGSSKKISVLPLINTHFIGRNKELADLTFSLAQPEHRLITITGIGGSGKTRIALEAARQAQPMFSNGVAFVDLTPLGSPEQIASKIVETLKLELRGNISQRKTA